MRTTAGGVALRLSSSLASPMTCCSSARTILMKTWPGERLLPTSVPRARSLTRSMKSLTTGRATSASSRARRTSRRLSWMFSSLSLALPVMLRRVAVRRSVSVSNMDFGARSLQGREMGQDSTASAAMGLVGFADGLPETRAVCETSRMYAALSGLVAVVFYSLGSFYQSQNLSSTRNNRGKVLTCGLIAVVTHLLNVYWVIRVPGGYDFDFFNMATLFSWTIAVIVLLSSLKKPLENLFLALFPLAVISITFSTLLGG